MSNQPQSIDSKIREKQKQKDIAEEKKLSDDFQMEEKVLKEYFKGLSQPVKEDPTLIRRKRYEEKMSTYRQVMQDVQPKKMINDILNFTPATPEEIETVYDCKNYLRARAYESVPIGLLATSLISSKQRITSIFYYTAIGAGVVVGIGTGIMVSFLRSTEYILGRMEALGPDYQLGRMAIQEIEDYRMDKQYKKAL